MSSLSSEEDDSEVMSVLHKEEGERKQEESSNTVATASITSQQTAGEKGVQRRLRWAAIPKNVSDRGAKQVIANFLADSNEKDKVFARHLMTERPYCAEHGTNKNSTKMTASKLRC
jgi:hypothetical protein